MNNVLSDLRYISELSAYEQFTIELALVAHDREVEILEVLFADAIDVFRSDSADFVNPGLVAPPAAAEQLILGQFARLRVVGFELGVVVGEEAADDRLQAFFADDLALHEVDLVEHDADRLVRLRRRDRYEGRVGAVREQRRVSAVGQVAFDAHFLKEELLQDVDGDRERGVVGAYERRRGERAPDVIRGDRAFDDLEVRGRSLGEDRRRFELVIAAREFAEAGFDFAFDLVLGNG